MKRKDKDAIVDNICSIFTILLVVSLIVNIIYLIYATVYWTNNPGLSIMQVIVYMIHNTAALIFVITTIVDFIVLFMIDSYNRKEIKKLEREMFSNIEK